jgi:pimeloyl-ACP methyl ester carboxylesterase
MVGGQNWGWRLGRRTETSGGEVAYEVFGEGTPLILVHGTPSRSYLWQNVAPALAERFRVYVYDLLGFGESERHEGQDVSIAAQGRALAELVEPAVAGHDIGGGIAHRAHLVEGVSFDRIALLDAVVLTPWGTPALRHVKEYLDAYRTMPLNVFEDYVAVRLREATNRPIEEEAFEAYLSQWRGPEGQTAYLRKDAALEERDTEGLEALLGSIGTPILVVWGEEDEWLDPSQATTLAEKIPNAELKLVAGAGHFVMEDASEEVVETLASFFAASRETAP